MRESAVIRRAERIDGGTGVREVAEFTDVDGTSLFMMTHVPSAPAREGLVICSPLYQEAIRNYRREVVLARALAEVGIAVQRFHYRGHGNSEGMPGAMTLETMLVDAAWASRRLQEVAGPVGVSFLGTRFGGLIAGAAARESSAPVILWDPVLDPEAYLLDIFRASRVQSVRMKDGLPETAEALRARLESAGKVPVLGYEIYVRLFTSARGQALETAIGTTPRRLLVIRMGREPRESPRVEALIRRWRDLSFDVADHVVGRREAWWFTSGPDVAQEAATEATTLTVRWMLHEQGRVARP